MHVTWKYHIQYRKTWHKNNRPWSQRFTTSATVDKWRRVGSDIRSCKTAV